MNYDVRTTQKTILPVGDPIFSEAATTISIDDEAAGEFLIVKQEGGNSSREPHSVLITPEEWPTIRATIDEMMETLRDSKP